MDRYKALTVLAVVADAGSMRRAARILGMTPSGVSQHIAQLEKDTRVTLLHRSSRRITLTEAGEALYAAGAAVLAAVQAAELRLAELRDTPAGVLTISVPPGLAERRLVEVLGPVLESHPAPPLPTVAEELAAGRLTRILTAWQLPPTEVVMVMPLRAHQPAKVRWAVDALREGFAPTADEREPPHPTLSPRRGEAIPLAPLAGRGSG
jgi:DNA-binding transcriptional LysR family regulator